MHRIAALAVLVFASTIAAADPAPAAKHAAELEHVALPGVAQHAGATAKTATELGRASLAALTARFKVAAADDAADILRYRVLEADRWLAPRAR